MVDNDSERNPSGRAPGNGLNERVRVKATFAKRTKKRVVAHGRLSGRSHWIMVFFLLLEGTRRRKSSEFHPTQNASR